MSRISYNYNGPFKEYIEGYLTEKLLEEKNIISYKYILKMFDKYTIENPPKDNILTKDYMENWLIKRPSEKLNTVAKRAIMIKSFILYLNKLGVTAYIIDTKKYSNKSNFIPHIYTKEELKKFFYGIDIIQNTESYPYKQEMFRLMFEILYCCGLRLSELINIKKEDINLNSKTILINNSKNHNNRIIVINQHISDKIRLYSDKVIDFQSDYLFFSVKTLNHISKQTFHDGFSTIIKNIDLNENIKYRIHDFRHTFAVNCLKKLYLVGEDINVILPVLMIYMGHSDIRSTEYYLRFTFDIYPEFLEEYNKYFHNIIPNIGELYE